MPHYPALSQTRRALQRHSSWLKRLDCLKGSQTHEHTRVKNVCEAKGTLWRRGGIQGSLLRKRIPRSHQKEEIYRAVRKLPLVTWRRGGAVQQACCPSGPSPILRHRAVSFLANSVLMNTEWEESRRQLATRTLTVQPLQRWPGRSSHSNGPP